MPEQNHYVLLGGPEHLDWFEHFEDDPLSQFFWTVPQNAQVYDVAFVYLTAPVSRIVGKVLIVGEPFYNVAEFENRHTKNSWMAEIKFVAYFESHEEITMRGLRALFPDWAWLSYPRGKTKIPPAILTPFLELISSVEGHSPAT